MACSTLEHHGTQGVGSHVIGRPGADTRQVNDEEAREPSDPGGVEPTVPWEGASAAALSQPNDVDVEFASIIARWDDEASDPHIDGLPTVTIDTDRPEPLPSGPPLSGPPLSGPPLSGPPLSGPPEPTLPVHPMLSESADGGEQLFGWRGHTPPPDDEHFEIPTPVLPPAHDATYWLSVAGMTLGPLLILWAAVLSRDPDPGWWVLAGTVLTVAGFGLMVLRGSGERDPDDNGAQV